MDDLCESRTGMGNGNEVSKDGGNTEFCSINKQDDVDSWHKENSKYILASNSYSFEIYSG